MNDTRDPFLRRLLGAPPLAHRRPARYLGVYRHDAPARARRVRQPRQLDYDTGVEMTEAVRRK